MKIVVKAKDDKHAFARLKVAGLRVNVEDDEGNKIRREDQMERCLTPSLLCTDGDVVFTTDIREDYIDKIPTVGTPNFEVVWREDDHSFGDDQDQQHPWPTFEVDTFDENGDKDGTTMQGVGRII